MAERRARARLLRRDVGLCLAAAVVAATFARQKTGRPVCEWERARLDEIQGRAGYNRVSEYMQTDVLTVHADDPIELVAGNRGEVHEIEAEAVGRHERAGLLDVRAQHLAQRCMQQVRGGVIPPRRIPHLIVDNRGDDVSLPDNSLLNGHRMQSGPTHKAS